MVQLQLVAQYEDEKYEIEYDTEDGRDVLGWQLFSLTGLDPEEQRISGLFKEGFGDALCDGVKDGQVFILSKNSGDTAGRENNAGRDTSGPPLSQLASLAVKSDEELARQLQEEEDAQLARTLMHIEQRAGPARHLPPNVDAFRARLESGIQTVMQAGAVACAVLLNFRSYNVWGCEGPVLSCQGSKVLASKASRSSVEARVAALLLGRCLMVVHSIAQRMMKAPY
jgi:hypothetical protein